jgi:hypothetical protein
MSMTIEAWAAEFSDRCAQRFGNPDDVTFTGICEYPPVGRAYTVRLLIDGKLTDRHRSMRLMNHADDLETRLTPEAVVDVCEETLTGAVAWVRFSRGKITKGTHCCYCGRAMPDVVREGCGSQEFPTQERVNELCEVYQQARRKG